MMDDAIARASRLRKRQRSVPDLKQIAAFCERMAARVRLGEQEERLMGQLWEDFRKFIMRGNVLDLAVAVVIGVAFNAVVNSLVNDVIMQLVAAIVGEPDFSKLT